MKKALSFIFSAALAVSSIPMCVSAADGTDANGRDLTYDLNMDGVVDQNDLTSFYYYFQLPDELDTEIKDNIDANGDLNNDGSVNGSDHFALAFYMIDSGLMDPDYNKDGRFSAADVRHLLNYYADSQTSIQPPSDEVIAYYVANGDFNGDGLVGPFDASMLLIYYESNALPGDINEDGMITPIDAAFLISYYADLGTNRLPDFVEMTDEQLAAKWIGDVSGDGAVTPMDAALILQTYAESATSIN